MQRIRLALGSIPGLRLFRNNTGKIEDRFGRWVEFGLCPGSADLIGWKSITVTREMVGKPVAIFAAIEVKVKNGHRAQNQKDFLNVVKEAGGIAGFADSVEEAIGVVYDR